MIFRSVSKVNLISAELINSVLDIFCADSARIKNAALQAAHQIYEENQQCGTSKSDLFKEAHLRLVVKKKDKRKNLLDIFIHMMKNET